MAVKTKSGKSQLAFGYIVIAVVIGAIIWGATALISHPSETHTASNPKPTQAASTKPEVASVNSKLSTVLSALKKKYPNANDSYIFTASKDPTSGLNKPAQYNAGAAFCDNFDTLYTPQDTTDTGGSANAYGYECGGTISVYSNDADAVSALNALKKVTTDPNSGKCLLSTQGNSECGYSQIGHTIIHVSDVLTDSQQKDFLTFLSTEITSADL